MKLQMRLSAEEPLRQFCRDFLKRYGRRAADGSGADTHCSFWQLASMNLARDHKRIEHQIAERCEI